MSPLRHAILRGPVSERLLPYARTDPDVVVLVHADPIGGRPRTATSRRPAVLPAFDHTDLPPRGLYCRAMGFLGSRRAAADLDGEDCPVVRQRRSGEASDSSSGRLRQLVTVRHAPRVTVGETNRPARFA